MVGVVLTCFVWLLRRFHSFMVLVAVPVMRYRHMGFVYCLLLSQYGVSGFVSRCTVN
jgi:hypothetical protein